MDKLRCSSNFNDVVKLPRFEECRESLRYYDICETVSVKMKGNSYSFMRCFGKKGYTKVNVAVTPHKKLIIYKSQTTGLVLELSQLTGLQSNKKATKIGMEVDTSLQVVLIFPFGRIKIATNLVTIESWLAKLQLIFRSTTNPMVKRKSFADTPTTNKRKRIDIRGDCETKRVRFNPIHRGPSFYDKDMALKVVNLTDLLENLSLDKSG
uniref:PH domain-containing protein n=1 Tax=Rhabditophanes sp. KR3021 TaxID=114890 RepID=A0AC35TZW2_9BILA